MTRDELRSAVLRCLSRIAPEVDVDHIEPAVRLRDQVDLDSVDWLNFLVAVHAELGVDIPDAEAARLPTLDSVLDYCGARLGVA
jgi:acyl carrier protein